MECHQQPPAKKRRVEIGSFLFRSRQNADMQLSLVDNGVTVATLPVHKVILRAYSGYFRTLFRDDNSITEVVEVATHAQVAVYEMLLQLLYIGYDMPTRSERGAFAQLMVPVLRLADRFQVDFIDEMFDRLIMRGFPSWMEETRHASDDDISKDVTAVFCLIAEFAHKTFVQTNKAALETNVFPRMHQALEECMASMDFGGFPITGIVPNVLMHMPSLLSVLPFHGIERLLELRVPGEFSENFALATVHAWMRSKEDVLRMYMNLAQYVLLNICPHAVSPSYLNAFVDYWVSQAIGHDNAKDVVALFTRMRTCAMTMRDAISPDALKLARQYLLDIFDQWEHVHEWVYLDGATFACSQNDTLQSVDVSMEVGSSTYAYVFWDGMWVSFKVALSSDLVASAEVDQCTLEHPEHCIGPDQHVFCLLGADIATTVRSVHGNKADVSLDVRSLSYVK